MRVKESNIDNEPQIVMERVRRNSAIKSASQVESDEASSGNKNEIEMNTIKNQYTFSPNRDSSRRPSVLKTDTIKRMHSAVELNKRILEKSKEASLVLINIPAPPKVSSAGDYNCKLKKIFENFHSKKLISTRNFLFFNFSKISLIYMQPPKALIVF